MIHVVSPLLITLLFYQQDLKDLMKKAGRVTFADILKDVNEG